MNNPQTSTRSQRRSRCSRMAVTLSVMLLAVIPGISSAHPPAPESALPTDRGQSVAGEVEQSGANQRFMLPAKHRDRLPSAATVLHDYGPSILVETPAKSLGRDLRPLASELEDFGRLNYRAWSGDITAFAPNRLEDARDAYFLLALTGPLDKQWIETIEAGGIRTVDHVNPYGLLVRGDADSIRHVADRLTTSTGHAVITAALPLPGDSRVSEALAPWLTGQREAGDIGIKRHEGAALVKFVAHGDADVESLAAQLSSRLVPGPEFEPRFNGLQFAATPSAVRDLLDEIPEIAFVHGVYPRVLLNNLAAKEHMTNIETVWNEPTLGYTGEGIIVGINDSGLDMTHPDFPPEAVVATSGVMSDGINAHGTHVAGTVAGRGTVSSPSNDAGCGDQSTPLSAPRGMAWEARITHNNLLDGGIGGVTQMMQWHAEQGADLTNNSWSHGVNNSYSSSSGEVDTLVRDVNPSSSDQQQMTIVFAAGNAGPGPGTVVSPGNAKNAITVGASQNDRCASYIPSMCDGPDIDSMACFSGRGPAQQRIKPDVVAPGTDVLSTGSRQDVNNWDQDWTGPDLQLMPGTSMATPVVGGAAAIFLEFFDDRFGARPSPALVRGAFINTATDMGMGFPSMDQGWGRINLRKAIEGPEHGEIHYFEQDQVDHLATGERWETTIDVLSSDQPFRTTLTWTDPPGSAGCDPCHINDLDLIVTAPDGTVHRGNQFNGHWSEPNPSDRDAINNAENVYVESPQTGEWSIEVYSVNTAENPPDLDGQDFALVVSGATGLPVEPEIVIDPEAFAVNLPVDTQHIEPLDILNPGDAPLEWSFDADPDPDHQTPQDRSTSDSNGCASPAEIDWLDVNPVSGTTDESTSSTVDVHFDSDGLAEGTHQALLCIHSNDPGNALVEVPVALTVGTDEASQLAFEVQPSTTFAGELVEPAVIVEVRDGFGEVVSSDNDTVVELTLSGGDAAAQLSGTVSVQVSGGVAVFDDLAIDTPGAGYSLLAADAHDELDEAVSAEFNILDGEILHDRFEELEQ